jgi:chromosome segregation ATPase
MNSPYKQYYTNYKEYVSQINDLEKKIRQGLTTFKQQSGKGPTLQIEAEIKDLLKQYKELYTNLETAYSRRNVPGGFPELTIDERQKEIQKFGINYNDMDKDYKNVEENKYKFKNEIQEDYSQKEEYKNMTTGELMAVQKNKLKEQDKQIDDITLDVKKGTQLAKNAGHVMQEQNKQLEQMNQDIDRTKDNMNKLTGRFESYVAKFSMCKMITILIIELIIGAVIIILYV